MDHSLQGTALCAMSHLAVNLTVPAFSTVHSALQAAELRAIPDWEAVVREPTLKHMLPASSGSE